MKKIKLSISAILPILAVMFIFCNTAKATTFAGGDGSEANPYQISTTQQLISIGDDETLLDKCFVLTANIDLAANSFNRALIAPDRNSNTSGFQGTTFTGKLNGNGNIIANLSINTQGQDSDFLGLIGGAGTGAELKNIGLENINIMGGVGSLYAGSFVAKGEMFSIDGCFAEGNIIAGDNVGGLVGWINCRDSYVVSNSYASVNVEGNEFVAGLFGYNVYSITSNCYCNGQVKGNDNAGAFVGYLFNSSGRFSQCYYDTDTYIDSGGAYYPLWLFAYVRRCGF